MRFWEFLPGPVNLIELSGADYAAAVGRVVEQTSLPMLVPEDARLLEVPARNRRNSWQPVGRADHMKALVVMQRLGRSQ